MVHGTISVIEPEDEPHLPASYLLLNIRHALQHGPEIPAQLCKL
jgi:hypothetical protein